MMSEMNNKDYNRKYKKYIYCRCCSTKKQYRKRTVRQILKKNLRKEVENV